jgi:Flp pilus assembly pilin Flp
MNRLLGFLLDEEAATAVEYAVMLAMILLVAIGSIQAFGAHESGAWQSIHGNLQQAGLGQ